ncbi:MAG: SGNH/GDSL hydrolase family protein [Oscillospiraceae bacterium]|nr:SGNH/GDSL hydrolase family protein [Oscillospiraceae bacterium]
MKILSKITALSAVAAVMLCGCGSTDDPSGDTAPSESSEVTEITEETAAAEETTTKAPETEEEFHAAMINRSLLSKGNNYRMKKVIEKLKNGEKTTFAYLGGSITEGVGASPVTCWAKLSFDGICEMFGNTNSEYINAGLSGTPSVLGNIRAERDILQYSPDVVFIEFAVNDAQDNTHKESYESLIDTILKNHPDTAVILMFNRTENGYTCQQHMSALGEYYSLPMISVNDAITAEFDEGRMIWDDYSNDSSHPNEYGHSLLAEMVENLFSEVDKDDTDEPANIPVMPQNGFSFVDMKLVTPDSPSDTENFTITDIGGFTETNATVSGGFSAAYANNGEGTPMKLHMNGNSFFIIYKRNNSADMGSIDVSVNGEKVMTINANDPDGWGDPYAAQVIKFSKPKEMDIEIAMTSDTVGSPFEIVGFGYSCNDTEIKF